MIPTATFSIHRFLLSVLSHLPLLLSVPTVVSFTSLLSPSCSLAAEEHECELEFVSSISTVVKKKKKFHKFVLNLYLAINLVTSYTF